MTSRRRILAIALAVVVVVSAIGYAAYVSHGPPGSSCAGAQTAARPLPSPGAGSYLGPRSVDTNPSRTLVGEHRGPVASPLPSAPSSTPAIHVVAAENFWGSLVSQIGGNATSVLSIVSDPNADPHEYEANTSDAVAIDQAQLVIVNGVGYDDWALQLIGADTSPGQLVLNAGTLNGVVVGGGVVNGNPHLWYNPVYVNRTVAAMFADLVQIAPGDASQFAQNYAALNASLASLYAQATSIKTHFAGAIVASTEDIFVYLANFTGLFLVSPPEFMEAVAEGND
ncbi:MAG: zinc ABC transporter substrate-binding protein, partial [Thermoplasmata archaeon]|nr:zinc ABC transporter substrate-binding protein [Thermoplasmata archaeon]